MNETEKIALSQYTLALISTLKSIKPRPRPDDLSKIEVSQTVSFFALVYEKMRNAVEFRDDHLILRAAIERILKRRLAINPEGFDEAENLLRELLWARYFDNGSFGKDDVVKVQKIIDTYLKVRKKLIIGRPSESQFYLNEFIFDLLTSEIEETLSPEKAQKQAAKTFYIYQVLRKKIKIEEINEAQKDAIFLAALEKVFRKSDRSYQRYHLFITFYQPLSEYSKEELEKLIPKLPEIFKRIDEFIQSPYIDILSKFIKKNLPPFIILFDVVEKKIDEIESILTDQEKLKNTVDLLCREKYQQLATKIRNLAIRAFIYIFLTKMIFALILEFPLSNYFYGTVDFRSITINTLFPPILMALIVLSFQMPDEENTKRIFQRLIEIINKDQTFEETVSLFTKRRKIKKSILIFGFTVFYSLTFLITFSLIHEVLTQLNFNLISEGIFIFFVSVVTFFSYRIKQSVNELKLSEKESVFTPLVDFFFMPILSLGKFFSQEIAKLNFFIFLFDFIIEAPFKLLFEIVEEWIAFVRKRKEEII